jgi:hypothetical protein
LRTTNPTPKKGERLLAVLRVGGTVMAACQAERIHRSTYYAWRAADPEFAAQADDAIESGTDELEEIARQRAITGSDTLLIFLLKARRPEKYRERQTIQGGDKPVEITITRRIVHRRIGAEWKRTGNAAEREATLKDHPA